jgi:xanthine/CO dehydrogenase XdhC/CoxF family maturation factor
MAFPILPLLAGAAAVYLVKRMTSKLEQQPAVAGPLVRRRLQELSTRPLPPELAVPTPRSDVWGERGYLSQPRYQSLYKPLLLQGHATWGLVYQYESTHDGEGPDTVASYAWLDARGELQTRRLKESYDGMHAALSQGQGDIILDMDAHLEADKVILILHDLASGQHIIYEALQAAPASVKET